MANRIYVAASTDTLQTIASAYHWTTRADGSTVDKVRRDIVIRGIRKATPTSVTDLTTMSDTDTFTGGETLFIPTDRKIPLALQCDDSNLLADLKAAGLTNSSRLLKRDLQTILTHLDTASKPYDDATVTRCYRVTELFTVDGVDEYTARYFYDTAGITDLPTLASQSVAQLDSIISTLQGTPHNRPAELSQQDHSRRWRFEARIRSRTRQGEHLKAHTSRLFPIYVKPKEACELATFYEEAGRSSATSPSKAKSAQALSTIYRFQMHVARANRSIGQGRWSDALEGFRAARATWHRFVESTGVASDIDDKVGVNVKTCAKAVWHLLNVLPDGDDNPMDPPIVGCRPPLVGNTRYGIRGVGYDELSTGERTNVRNDLQNTDLSGFPDKFVAEVTRASLDLTKDQLIRADRSLVDGLTASSSKIRGRDLADDDVGRLKRNLGSVPFSRTFSGGSNLDVLEDKDVARHLSMSSIQGLTTSLWTGSETVSSVVSDPSIYPTHIQTASPFVRFIVLPALSGASTDTFIPAGSSADSFASGYRTYFLEDRLKSTTASDLFFDREMWHNPSAFAALIPLIYGQNVQMGMYLANSRLGLAHTSDLNATPTLMDSYDDTGSLLNDLYDSVPDSLGFDFDLLAGSTTLYLGSVSTWVGLSGFLAGYIGEADLLYASGDTANARIFYIDVMNAIELVIDILNAQDDYQAMNEGVGSQAPTEDPPGAGPDVPTGLPYFDAFNTTVDGTGVGEDYAETGWSMDSNMGGFGDLWIGFIGTVGYDSPPEVSVDTTSDTRNVLDWIAYSVPTDDMLASLMSQFLYCATRVTMIDQGLNFVGYPNNYVPPWSFDHLYGIARDLCNRALEAEQRVFTLLQLMESAQRDELMATYAVETAGAQLAIAKAQKEEQLAANELAAIQADINKESADLAADQNMSDGVIGGFLGAGLGSGGTAIGTGIAVASLSASAPALPLIAGAAGIALVGGAISAIGASTRQKEHEYLAALAQDAVEATTQHAEAALNVATLQVNAASLAKAQANEYLRFLHDEQLLNSDGYAYLLSLAREMAEHYMAYAVKVSWFAQRALSHETRKVLSRIDLLYRTSNELLDMTQAQRLTADIEGLRADYVAGQLDRRQQIKWTTTLSMLNPGALKELRESGACTFYLSQRFLDLQFPGTYLHSLKEMRLAFIGTLPASGPRGSLKAIGPSWVRVPNTSDYLLEGEEAQPDWIAPWLDPSFAGDDAWDSYASFVMRTSHGSPVKLLLSEFDVRSDRAVMQAPQGMLSPVEYSGMDGMWVLSLPRTANDYDFSNITDVEFTFWFLASHSEDLEAAQREALTRMGTSGNLEGSAGASWPQSSADQWARFAAPPADPDALDLRFLNVEINDSGLPRYESSTGRKLTNLMLGAAEQADLQFRLVSESDPAGVLLTTTDGVIFSALGTTWDATATHQPDTSTGGLEEWVDATYYKDNPDYDPVDDPRLRIPDLSPEERFAIKVSPAKANPSGGPEDWRDKDEDGALTTTSAGPLVGAAGGTASFDGGTAWDHYSVRFKLRKNGGSCRIHLRHDGNNNSYVFDITSEAGANVRFKRLDNNDPSPPTETLLSEVSGNIAFPDDEFLLIEARVTDDGSTTASFEALVDTIPVLEASDTGTLHSAGTVLLENTDASLAVWFDDVEVRRLTMLGAEAETLLVDPLSSAAPAGWTMSAGDWSLGTAHYLLDLSALEVFVLNAQYTFEVAV